MSKDLKNADNEALFHTLRECLSEICITYEPMIQEWMSVLTAVEVEQRVKLIVMFKLIIIRKNKHMIIY